MYPIYLQVNLLKSTVCARVLFEITVVDGNKWFWPLGIFYSRWSHEIIKIL